MAWRLWSRHVTLSAASLTNWELSSLLQWASSALYPAIIWEAITVQLTSLICCSSRSLQFLQLVCIVLYVERVLLSHIWSYETNRPAVWKLISVRHIWSRGRIFLHFGWSVILLEESTLPLVAFEVIELIVSASPASSKATWPEAELATLCKQSSTAHCLLVIALQYCVILFALTSWRLHCALSMWITWFRFHANLYIGIICKK